MPAAISNLVELLQERVRNCPDRAAYIFLAGEELRQSRLTYRELDSRARSIAALLQGLEAQDERALLLYPPGLEFIAAFFGCLYAGVVAVPAYPPRLNRNALRILSIAKDSQARFALTSADVLSRLSALTAHMPELGQLQWYATDTLPSDAAKEWREFSPQAEGLAYLQYTSGSTATPKGVMITHANVLHNSGYLAEAFRHSAHDVSLSWLPHFHDLGLVHGILQPLYSCFPGYLMAPMSFLQRPVDWLRAISRFRITHSDGPNFAYELCLNKITEEEKRELDLSSWWMALSGAEPIFPDTIKRFAAAFASCGFKRTAFFPAYGLAEATLVVSGGKKETDLFYCRVSSAALEENRITFANEDSPGARMLVASGAVGPGMHVAVVEPVSVHECSPDQIGEIWVAGPSVAMGYWKRPQETEQVFRAALAETGEHRFLRTGDLGFMRDGYLFITSRLKELIIIRGRNYYPQDIERTARESCPAVRLGTGAAFSVSAQTGECMVLVQEVPRRQKVDAGQIFRSIREAIAEEHEVQIHEIVLVAPGSVPRTSSGKIQRNLCRKEFLDGRLEVTERWRAEQRLADTGASPRLDHEGIQSWLVAQVAFAIGVDLGRIDIHRPLLSLGLDSLSAVELAHKVERTLGLAWQATGLLEKTLAELAQAAKSSAGERTNETSSRASTTPSEYPLSYGQQGLWFLHQLAPESTAYNVAQAIRVKSRVDVSALQQSFQALVDRHSCLRTTFTAVNGSPVQRVREQLAVTFLHENARGWSEAHMQQRLTEEAAHQFDLEHGPLLRIHLFTCAPDDHVLLLTAHHIILDLWSLAQLMQEIGVLYEAATMGKSAVLPPVSADYSEFVRRQKEMLSSDRGHELWAYWNKQLCGELPVLDLMTDHPRPPVQTYRGSSHPFRLGFELTEKLKNLSHAHGTTLYMTLLAAFQALLHRYTGEEEILTGSPVAGRTSAEFASTVGYFVNPVVLRTSISTDSTFETLLSHVRRTVLDALEHQDYPFALLTEKLRPGRDSSRSPLFQVMFAMQKAPQLHEEGLSLFALGEYGARMNLGGLELESVRLEQRIAQFDLSLVMAEAKDELAATFEYNTALFDATTVSRMAEHFTTLLHGVVENPKRPISGLPLAARPSVSRSKRAEGAQPLTSSSLVHVLFEQQAARTPDAPALILEGEQLTYKELNERVNQMAQRILDLLEKPGAPVGLFLERSAEAIIGLLAIFKAGAVYVPVDPEYPKDRIAFLLDDAAVEVVVTQQRFVQLLPRVSAKVLCVNAEQQSVVQPKVSLRGISSDDPAYVIYTSGSTGQPKGVLVSHGALINHMQWLAHEFPLHQGDRVLHKYSLSFDASLAEIFHPLISGAALVVARSGSQYDICHLVDLMREHRVTAIDVVPTMFKALLEDGRMQSCATLRRITSGGETLPTDIRQRVFEDLGEIELINMYGPTETAITASFHRCQPGENGPRVAIGAPVANSELYVLDREMQPVPPGIPGEIYIGGKGLAYGYINQPALTGEKFVPDPFSTLAGARLYKTGDVGRYRDDGDVEYIRRIDNQVKVRGFRIELAEIEAQLRKHGAVQAAIAVVRSRAGGDKYIAAYVQCPEEAQVTSAQLRVGLREKLPQYMLPAAINVLKSFPLFPNGKVDFRGLPEPEKLLDEDEFALPRDAAEKTLVRIWQEVLRRNEVGIHSNFFELGGDSILSIQIVSHARDAGLVISPKQVFQFQTIAGLAQMAGRGSTKSLSRQSTAQGPVPVPLSPIQRWFFDQELPEPHFYNQSMMLTVKRTLDAKLLERAVHHVAIEHDALRLRFHRTPLGWQQVCVRPEVKGICRHVILPQLPPREQSERIEAITREAQASLNLEAGPLMRAVYFDGTQGGNRLLIVIHHLAVDGVSWRVILDDLQAAYEPLERGEDIRPREKTLSFKQWSELLQERAQDDAVRQEFGYWSAQLSKAVPRLPLDRAGENSVADSATEIASLNQEETQLLLRKVPNAFRTQINDVLLTAFAQTLAAWTGESRALFDLEGHGREEIIDGADLSRSVGWFTSIFPVLVEINPAASTGEALCSVKEQLRRIPSQGIGYGLLRYLCSDENISRQLGKLPRAQISFNYLGQLDQMCSPDSLFSLAEAPLAAMQSSRGKRSYVIEVDAYIKDRQLQVLWGYSSLLHRRETIQQLAGNFIEKLRALIQHCAEQKYTPSDFSLIKLTQRQIDRIQQVHGQIEDIYSLSSMQHGMLFHSLFEPQKRTYLTQLICELEGDLDRPAFRDAWHQVVDNYAALRAGFEWEIVSDESVQVIRQDVELQWQEEDWSALSSWQQKSCLETYLKEDREREIDLRQAPLMHFALIHTAAAKHKFVWSSHHLVMDGWSLPIVLNDVLACYADLRRKQPVKLRAERPYRNYIQWLREQDLNKAADFWRRFLKDLDASTSLSSMLRVHSDNAFCEDFQEVEISLSEDSTSRLQALSRQGQLTLNTIVQGAWALLLSRQTGKDDVIFGVVCSGRPAQLADVESMVGLFINTLPMRARVAEQSNLIDWLKLLQEHQSEMSQFEYTPLSQVQAWSGLPRGTPLFESILVFENYPAVSWTSASEQDLRIASVQSRERSNYPLTLWVMPGQELHLKLGYDANRLRDAGIAGLLRDYQVLLEAIAANPKRNIASVLQSCELVEKTQGLPLAQKETDELREGAVPDFAHSARQGDV